MTETERQIGGLQAQETFSSISYLAILATALTISAFHLPSQATTHTETIFQQNAQGDTHQITTIKRETSATDLFYALNTIYDSLLSNQSDLDSDLKKVLYSNLWELYE